MRIAFISTIKGASWGGSEELWFSAAKLALKRRYEVGLFTYRWPENPPQINELLRDGAKLFSRKKTAALKDRLRIKVLHRMGIRLPDSLNPFAELIRFQPDHVIVTDGAMYYTVDDGWLRTTLLRHFSGKFVIVSQGNSSYHFPEDRAEAVRFFANSQAIVFVAAKNREQTFHQLAHRLERTSVIQNPVNLGAFEALPLNDGAGRPVHFAAVGRLSVGEKGQDILIAILAMEFWKNSNVFLHIYGKGRDVDYLSELITYYGVQDKVKLEGHKTPEEIWSQCQVLLMPSVSEGTPLTLLEAMVLGRICVVTDVGGNAEWIVDGVNGFLVAAPTVDLFENKMRHAVQNRTDWPEMARAAHESASRRIDREPGKTLLDCVTSAGT